MVRAKTLAFVVVAANLSRSLAGQSGILVKRDGTVTLSERVQWAKDDRLLTLVGANEHKNASIIDKTSGNRMKHNESWDEICGGGIVKSDWSDGVANTWTCTIFQIAATLISAALAIISLVFACHAIKHSKLLAAAWKAGQAAWLYMGGEQVATLNEGPVTLPHRL